MPAPRRLVMLVGITFVIASAHASDWYPLARRSTWIRNGMSPTEVRDVMEEGPFVGRLFRREGHDILEWSYPIDRKQWLLITFVDRKVVSRTKQELPAFRRQPVNVTAEPEKRNKLGTVHLGMTVAALDALGVVPDVVIDATELKQAALEAETNKLSRDLFGLNASSNRNSGLAKYEELRTFDLNGEMFYVAISTSTVSEMGTFFVPVVEDVQREIARALAAQKPTAENVRKVKPGMAVLEVLMLLGFPKAEKSVESTEGTVKVMTYVISRRQKYAIEIRDDVVIRITSDVRY